MTDEDRTLDVRTMTDGPVVVGVDGSAASKEALRWAAQLAGCFGRRIEAVIAWRFPANYGWPYAVPAGWQPEVDAGKTLEQTVDDVFGADRPGTLTTVVREGRASSVLLEASKNAGLLIVGSRGHGGFTGLLLGSVSAACTEHARCPVLVVHDPGSHPRRAGS